MKRTIPALFIALAMMASSSLADTSLTAYGTYWDADNEGAGAGLRLKKTFLAFAAVDVRGGYINFSDTNTEAIPLEASINARLPFFISPYIGLGAGYYFLDSDLADMDDSAGYFAQLGVEATFIWFGAMAEVRFHDLDEDYLDGTSFNLGLLLKW